MITVLEYLVIAAAIGLVVFLIAVFVFGRGEQMAALSPRTSPAELPEREIGGDDARRVRFGLALRGYRMSDVDWTLDRLADELDRLHHRVAELGGGPLPPGVGVDPTAGDLFPDEPGADGSSGVEPELSRPVPDGPGADGSSGVEPELSRPVPGGPGADGSSGVEPELSRPVPDEPVGSGPGTDEPEGSRPVPEAPQQDPPGTDTAVGHPADPAGGPGPAPHGSEPHSARW